MERLRGSAQRSRLRGDHKGPDVVQINMVRHGVVYKVLIGIASLLNAFRRSQSTDAALQFLYQTEHEVIIILLLHWRKAALRVSRPPKGSTYRICSIDDIGRDALI
jgi:hypothetical protein